MTITIDQNHIRIGLNKLRIEYFKTRGVDFITRTFTEDGGRFKIEIMPAAMNQPTTPRLVQEIRQLVETLIHNQKTIREFGRIHKANIKRNLEFCEFHTVQEKGRGKGVILASGPTLNLQKRYHGVLYALPSSLMALREAKIEPYAVIQLDPGYWAKMHTFYLPEGAILFCGLRASIPYKYAKRFKIVPYAVSDEEVKAWDTVYKTPIMRLTGGQTVAIPAIELVKKLQDSCEVVGLDLAYKDVQAHVKPHTFEYQNYLGGRLNPSQNTLYNTLMLDDPVKEENGMITTGGLRHMRMRVGHPKEYSYSLGIHRAPTLKPLNKDQKKAVKEISNQGEFEKLPRKIANA